MTGQQKLYLKRLHDELYGRLTDPLDKAIFYRLCKQLQEYYKGVVPSKSVEKKEMLEHLISAGLMNYRDDGGLPDFRPIRERQRQLLRRGYPILTSSTTSGAWISDRITEIDPLQKENHKRGVSVLEIDKGYNMARQFILGQTSMNLEEYGA